MVFPSHFSFKRTTVTTCVFAALGLIAPQNATAIEPSILADNNVSYGLGDKGQLLSFPKTHFSLIDSKFGPNTLYEGVSSLESGSVAITTTGDVITWPNPSLNSPFISFLLTPLGLSDVKKTDSTLVLTESKEVYTWGTFVKDLFFIKLVLPSKVRDQSNVALADIQDISSYTTSSGSALTNAGEVYAFEIASGIASTAHKVVDASTMTPITGITNIRHPLALTNTGQIYHWNIGYYHDNNSLAHLVKDEAGIALSDITQMTYGLASSALSHSGQVYTWTETYPDHETRLPTATLIKDSTDVPISNVKALLPTAALTHSGEVYDWKQISNSLGYKPSPATIVPGLTDVKEVATSDHMQIASSRGGGIALTHHGKVFIWQWDNASNQPLEAQQVPLEDIIKISASNGHVLALKANGDLCGWGNNDNGQLGANNPNSIPMTNPVCGLADLVTDCDIETLPKYSRVSKTVTFSTIAMETYTPEGRDKYALLTGKTTPIYLEKELESNAFKLPQDLVIISTGKYVEGTDHCYPIYSAERKTLNFKVRMPLVTTQSSGAIGENSLFECYDISMRQATMQPEIFHLTKADPVDCK